MHNDALDIVFSDVQVSRPLRAELYQVRRFYMQQSPIKNKTVTSVDKPPLENSVFAFLKFILRMI